MGSIINLKEVESGDALVPAGEYHLEIVTTEELTHEKVAGAQQFSFLILDGEFKDLTCGLMFNIRSTSDIARRIAGRDFKTVIKAIGMDANDPKFNTAKMIGKRLTATLKIDESGKYQNLVSARAYAGPAVGKAKPSTPAQTAAGYEDSDPFAG